ncbi:hypothetical protein MRX96_051891, partial [Rhipicephalus microplus]
MIDAHVETRDPGRLILHVDTAAREQHSECCAPQWKRRSRLRSSYGMASKRSIDADAPRGKEGGEVAHSEAGFGSRKPKFSVVGERAQRLQCDAKTKKFSGGGM